MPHRFANLDPAHQPRPFSELLRWGVVDRLTGRRKTQPPGSPAPWRQPDLNLIHSAEPATRITWIGHSSFLLSSGGECVLVDPVFSRRIGVLYPRHGRPGLVVNQLPRLSAVLVSHNHYDHFDEPSLLALPRSVPVVVPMGLGGWFRRRGFSSVHELDWWERAALGELAVSLVPARHWSHRLPGDTNRTLWGGFVVEAGGEVLYHAGDTAAFEGFREITRRFPPLAAALLPIGGYDPAWFMSHNHMNPEEAGEAFLTLGARSLIPMHWGAFQLTDESLSEPAERLRTWWRENNPQDGRRLEVMAVGETVSWTAKLDL